MASDDRKSELNDPAHTPEKPAQNSLASTELSSPSTALLPSVSPNDPDATEVVSPNAAPSRTPPTPAELNLKTGDLLRDRFEVDRVLGEGGMGKVFLAKDRQAESSNPWVALKLLNGSFSEHPMAFAALRREAMQSRALNHPNIVNVYDFDRTEDHVYMVMEFMRGEPLDDYVKAHPEGNQLKAIWPIVEGSGRGLTYVHQRNIIHADFKPSNVFLTEDNEVKVLDLGIARTLDENKSDSMTTRFDPEALGALTPQYASCEMFDGLTPIAADDLYALGCVTYELLTGKHPYNYKTAVQARSEQLEVKRPPGLKNRQWKALHASLALVRSERQEHVTDFLQAMNPEIAKTKSWPWIATTTAAVVAATSIVVLNLTPTKAEQLQAILDQNPPQTAQFVSTEKAQLWLEQGDFFLTSGSNAMMAKDFDFAATQLTLSANSALRSFTLVLQRSDEPSLRNQAAEGVLKIATSFTSAVVGLQAQNQESSATTESAEAIDSALLAKLTCNGLQAAKTPDLVSVYAELEDSNPQLIRNSPACSELSI